MSGLLYGALGAVFVLALIFAGFLLGWTARGYAPGAKKAEAAQKSHADITVSEETVEAEKERQRIIQEQNAFTTMMGYGPDVAYGLAAGPPELTKRE